MQIHVVTPGQTLDQLARTFDVPTALLAAWNGLSSPDRLAIGQSLLILTPDRLSTVQPGDTLFSIARQAGVSLSRLYQLNPQLRGQPALQPGQILCLSLTEQPTLGRRNSFGYAYPNVQPATLRTLLPYAAQLMPFTCGIGDGGTLLRLSDESLLTLAGEYGVRPVLHLSTLTEDGSFSSQRAEAVLSSEAMQQALIEQVLQTCTEKGYQGVDVDFEYLPRSAAAAYSDFIARLRTQLQPRGGEVFVALAPKTSIDQPGLLYEGHDYAALGAAADAALLMSYEWGYSWSAPMAVAPINRVREVVEFAVSQIPARKLFLGFPNYGYDWLLPYDSGRRARVIGNDEAVALAVRYGASIEFDETAQTPFFRYRDEHSQQHEVWFEDARSALAKYQLLGEFDLLGVGFWNFMRPFAAGFTLLAALAQVGPDGM